MLVRRRSCVELRAEQHQHDGLAIRWGKAWCHDVSSKPVPHNLAALSECGQVDLEV